MMRSLPRSRILVIAAASSVAAALATGAPGGAVDASPMPVPVDTAFTVDAMRACTAAIHAHLADHGSPDPVEVFALVVERHAEDQGPPPPATLEEWADVTWTEAARLSSIREALGAVESDDPATQAAWGVVVGIEDVRIDGLQRRAAALTIGDWGIIVATFLATRGITDAPFEQALETLGLEGTDCRSASQWFALDAVTRPFHVSAAEACTTIVSRRAIDGHRADVDTVLRAVIDIRQDGPDAVLDGDREVLMGALERLAEEWRATLVDLEAVDAAGAPDAAAWDDVLTVARERTAMIELRRAALASGSADEVAAAFTPGAGVTVPGFDWWALGLDRRACMAVAA